VAEKSTEPVSGGGDVSTDSRKANGESTSRSTGVDTHEPASPEARGVASEESRADVSPDPAGPHHTGRPASEHGTTATTTKSSQARSATASRGTRAAAGSRMAMFSTPAWRRLRRAFRLYVSRAQLAGAVLLALLGFAATTQVQSVRSGDEFASADRPELIRILDGLQQRSRRLDAEIRELERAKTELLSGADRTRTAVEQAQERAEVLGILAGTLPAEGPGIRLTITDSRSAVTSSVVLNTIQELRDAGAEAIEINDRVRVVASSYVLDGQGGIVVDGVLLRPPYTVDAIGESRTLATAMRIPGGVVDEVAQNGGLATIVEQENVEVDSLHEPTEPRFASPVPEESAPGTGG